MKLLLVSDNPRIIERLGVYFELRGIALIVYRHPLKALDNLEEISPTAVIYSAVDFGRHWKAFAVYLRYLFPDRRRLFVLLRGNYFPESEVDKAANLEVDALLPETFSRPGDFRRLMTVFRRFLPIGDNKFYSEASRGSPEFIFNHPQTANLVVGSVVGLSLGQLIFLPDYPGLAADLKVGQKLEEGSLLLGDRTYCLPTMVLRNQGLLTLIFRKAGYAFKRRLAAFLDRGFGNQRPLSSSGSQAPASSGSAVFSLD